MANALKEESEIERREKELKSLLEKRGLIDKNCMVDISKANKAYFHKQDWKAKKIHWNDFWNTYRTEYWSRKPKDYLEAVYGKVSYNEGYLAIGGETKIPIYAANKLGLGRPSIRTGVGFREKKVGQIQKEVEIGMEYDKKKISPYVSASAGGFFVTLAQTAKKFTEFIVGIVEGIFTIGAKIAKGVKYFLSVTLGPWIGRLDLKTGKVGGLFSWLIFAFEMVSKAIKRFLMEKNEFWVNEKFENIVEGKVLTGTNNKHQVISVKVVKITKKEENKIRFINENGVECVAEIDGDFIRVAEYRSFWKRLGEILNPIKLVKDAWDIVVIKPIEMLINMIDGFRSPDKNRKVSKEEVAEIEKKMWEAYESKNYNTARFYARLLVQSTSGEEKAKYLLALDDIEWAIANHGLFVGYIPGLGFGSKRKLVNKAIEARVREQISIIDKADPKSEEFVCAWRYIKGKAQFTTTRAFKKTPISYSPEHLQNEIIDASVRADERASVHYISGSRGEVNFRTIDINKNDPARVKKEKFMEFLQAAYEKLPERRKEIEDIYFNCEKDKYAWRQLTIDWYYTLFVSKTGGSILEKDITDIANLSKSKIAEIFNKWIPPKKK